MKWFKHISDSLDDPFIFDLMTEFKETGYLVFFGVLEIYAREFKPENGWKLVTTSLYFRQKLRISQAKVKKILLKIHKWEVEYKNGQVIIFIPKFKELMDDWSKRELRSNSVVTPKILIADKDKEEDKEKDKDIHIKKETKGFVVPTLDEVSSYCIERGKGINPQAWMDHYTSNGWMVGKNKMKDWKASVRTWERTHYERTSGNVGSDARPWIRRPGQELSTEAQLALDDVKRLERERAIKYASGNKAGSDA